MTTFNELGLVEPLLKALAAEGYETPTPIQQKAIPVVASGRDLLGIAQTGTGKTAAFALPILHRLAADRRPAQHRGCRALVLSPTRELATQIAESFRAYGRFLDMKVAVVFGGVAHKPQQQALARGVDVLVATPGRLLDHVGERNVVLSGTEIFVLDEADQMLDLGFVKPIRRIVSMLAHKRQNLFFSATMPHEIGALAAELLVEPAKIEIAPAATTVERVAQKIIHVEQSRKRALLVELFQSPELSRALVFTRTKRGADRVAQHLEGAGIEAAAIHGNKSQAQRERALDSFRRSQTRVLVATDIAARGIDIDLVSHVVNYELPEVPEQYVHRIGRTGRAGQSGIAISLCDGEERGLLRDIERLTRQQIPSEDRRGDTSLAETTVPVRRHGRGADHQQRRGADRQQNRGAEPRSERSADPRRAAPRSEGRSEGRSGGGQRNGSRPHGQGRGDERGPRSDRGGERFGQGGQRNGAHRGDGGNRHQERRRDNRSDARRDDRRDDRRGGLVEAGGWSPVLDEPVVMAPRRDERRHGERQPGERHHAGQGSRGQHGRPEHRGEHRGDHRGDRRPAQYHDGRSQHGQGGQQRRPEGGRGGFKAGR